MRLMIAVAALLLLGFSAHADAPTESCPVPARVARERIFEPGGLILTAFDRQGLWVVDIDARTRYPLEDTRLCGTNCRLSPDGRTVTYLDGDEELYRRMTLDGVYRETLYSDTANDVLYWSDDTLLIYTAGRRSYLLNPAGVLTEIDTTGVLSIQPGGLWAVALDYRDGVFVRQLMNLALRSAPNNPRIDIGPEARFYNAVEWSPDGEWVAAVVPVTQGDVTGGELVLANPNTREVRQVTDLLETVGPLRLGGLGLGGVSWSPDSRYVAFWGTPLTGDDPEIDVEPATLYIYDRQEDETIHYCGTSIEDTTPEPPRLVWSPDGSHVAFAGNPPDDHRGSLLIALNVESGVFTVLTDGLSSLLGRPNILAWGLRP